MLGNADSPGSDAGGEPRETYAVDESLPPAPPLPGAVVVRRSADELIDAVAADMVAHSMNCVRQFGDFHLALSGGRTPEPLYERLMYDPNYRRLAWRRTHLWIVDERCVPFDHEHSNFRMIRETIVDHSDIPPDQVHPMFAESETADLDYEKRLRDTLAWREKGHDRLDYVLLGMGADGHTASLFPGSELLAEERRLVRFAHDPRVEPAERVTMTLPLINAARFVAILVVGEAKAQTVRRVAENAASVFDLPVKGVEPLNGELHWYLDAGACGAGP